ncbi:hypothetical protein C8J57DRAFT_1232453 [Mycena rebaudengoi]|nr:hypothetical protein C8J57DRAFT_1232453 [Mycena rebaudengoi]
MSVRDDTVLPSKGGRARMRRETTATNAGGRRTSTKVEHCMATTVDHRNRKRELDEERKLSAVLVAEETDGTEGGRGAAEDECDREEKLHVRCGEADDELQRPIRELCAKDSALIRTSEREREKPLRASISVEADGEFPPVRDSENQRRETHVSRTLEPISQDSKKDLGSSLRSSSDREICSNQLLSRVSACPGPSGKSAAERQQEAGTSNRLRLTGRPFRIGLQTPVQTPLAIRRLDRHQLAMREHGGKLIPFFRRIRKKGFFLSTSSFMWVMSEEKPPKSPM